MGNLSTSKISTPVKSTPVKSTTVKSTPVKSTPVKSTPVKSAPVELALVESTPVETTLVKSAPVELAPVVVHEYYLFDYLVDTHKFVNLSHICGRYTSSTSSRLMFHNLGFDKADYIIQKISTVLYNMSSDLLPEHFPSNVMRTISSDDTKFKYSVYRNYKGEQQCLLSFVLPDTNNTVSFIFKPTNMFVLKNCEFDDLPFLHKQYFIDVIIEMYYYILIDVVNSYINDEIKFINYIEQYPVVLKNEYYFLEQSIFNSIFNHAITYQQKNKLYKLLTSRSIKPSGIDLLVTVCESSRICESKQHLYHGCSCCITSDEGLFYGDIIDDLIKNGYSLSQIYSNFLPIHVIFNEVNLEYIKWYFNKYGTTDINHPTLKQGFTPVMMLFGCCRSTVGFDVDILKILKYLNKLSIVNFKLVDFNGKTVLDHCKKERYPQSHAFLKNIIVSYSLYDLIKKYIITIIIVTIMFFYYNKY
jgi:hypothetical protein